MRQKCDPAIFKCNSTRELESIEGIIGQDRALSALKFGLNIMKPGFNIYVSGLAETVKVGNFHIYPVSTIDEGIEVLTGRKAGQQLEDGSFEPDSINDRIQKRLTALAEKLRDFTRGEEKARDTDSDNNESQA